MNKTVPTKISPQSIIKTFPKAEQNQALQIVELFEKATKQKCVMWGKIFGFGEYHYKYESGHEGDSLIVGFALPKGGITFYINGNSEESESVLTKLGKFKLKGSCLHVKKLEDVDIKVLEKLIKIGFKLTVKKWGSK